MILTHESHVFEIRIETNFEVGDPRNVLFLLTTTSVARPVKLLYSSGLPRYDLSSAQIGEKLEGSHASNCHKMERMFSISNLSYNFHSALSNLR